MRMPERRKERKLWMAEGMKARWLNEWQGMEETRKNEGQQREWQNEWMKKENGGPIINKKKENNGVWRKGKKIKWMTANKGKQSNG